MDTGGRAGTHPFLALSLPPISPFSPLKPLLSPSLCLSNKRCPDPKHSSLCLWDSAGRITVGRRKTLRSRQIPLLSSLTSCHFFSLFTYITQNVIVNDRIFWHYLALLFADELFRVYCSIEFFIQGTYWAFS